MSNIEWWAYPFIPLCLGVISWRFIECPSFFGWYGHVIFLLEPIDVADDTAWFLVLYRRLLGYFLLVLQSYWPLWILMGDPLSFKWSPCRWDIVYLSCFPKLLFFCLWIFEYDGSYCALLCICLTWSLLSLFFNQFGRKLWLILSLVIWVL